MMKNNDKVYGQIFVTKEYDKFKTTKGNRVLNKTNFVKLLQSMEEEQLIIPIIVNENYEIVDGQHRFNACRQLGKDVYYIINEGYGIDQVKRANLVSTNWSKEDYLNLHLSDSKDEYETFDKLLTESGMNISDLLKVYSKAQNKSYEQLDYEFVNGFLSNDNINEVCNFITALKDFDFYKHSRKKQFVAAFVNLFFDKRYNHDKMKEKLTKRSHILKSQDVNLSKEDYLVKLTHDLYSFGASKNNIYYDAKAKKLYS